MSKKTLELIQEGGHEQVLFCNDNEVGLKAIIAIHDTTLGPALGGTRMWPYASEDEALLDVLRLSKGMTFKAAATGLNLGGGKAVIIGDPKKDKTESLFRAYGRFVNSLNGRYITAEDVGTDVNDMEYVFAETDYVVGVERTHGGSGNPAPFTALGVYQSLKACAGLVFGDESLQDKVIVVQGVGQVGNHLIRRLKASGAKVFATDIDKEKLEKAQAELGFEIIKDSEVYNTPCDIFTPCALGAVVNDKTVNQFKCKIIAGAANNQLARPEHAEMLRERGILYAPDFVVNAGGLINVYQELEGYSRERSERMTRGIYYNLKRVFKLAKEEGISTEKAAERMVQERLVTLRRSGSFFQQNRKSVLSHLQNRRH